MRVKAGDVVLVAVLLLCCAALFLVPHFKKHDTLTAKVTVDGTVRETVVLSDLNGALTKEVAGCVLVFSREGVRFESADCPDRLCVKAGTLHKAGDTAACVPNRVVVTLVASGGTDGKAGAFDAEAY